MQVKLKISVTLVFQKVIQIVGSIFNYYHRIAKVQLLSVSMREFWKSSKIILLKLLRNSLKKQPLVCYCWRFGNSCCLLRNDLTNSRSPPKRQFRNSFIVFQPMSFFKDHFIKLWQELSGLLLGPPCIVSSNVFKPVRWVVNHIQLQQTVGT